MSSVKFMQSLGQTVYQELQDIADRKNISMQELVRAVIIPDWLRTSGEKPLLRAHADSQHSLGGGDSGFLAPGISHASHPASARARLLSYKES
jgi:hypothetical protein